MSKLREILNILDEKTKAEIIDELLILSDNNWERVVDIVDPGYIQRMEKAEEECVKDLNNIDPNSQIYCYDNRDKKVKQMTITTDNRGYTTIKYHDAGDYSIDNKKSDSKALTPQFVPGTAFRLMEGTFVIISGLLNSLVDRGPLHDYYWCVCVKSGRCRVGEIKPFTNYMIEKYAEIVQ